MTAPLHASVAGIATIQDHGRGHAAALGVPAAGPLDHDRYLLAAALVSTDPHDRPPVIELLAGTLSITSATAWQAALIGPADVVLDGDRTATGTLLEVPAGSTLSVTVHGRGPVYLAVPGLDPERVLGSAATDTLSGLGPAPLIGTRAIARHYATAATGRWAAALAPGRGPLRALAHPGGRRWLEQTWTVTATARSGVRLTPAQASSPRAPMPAAHPSGPTMPGVIQLPNADEAIVLGPDCGTTGGYPTLGAVITADLPRLAHLRPGDGVRFAVVDPAQAAAAHRDAAARRSRALRDLTDLG